MNNVKKVNRRVLAACLAVVFALSCFLGVNFALRAKGDGYVMEGPEETGSLILDKGIQTNSDGTYDLRLEAYATAPTAYTSLAENTPLDIVMVMDQSGSMMSEDFLTGTYTTHNPSFSVDDIETAKSTNHPLLYLAEDGNYYPVDYEIDTSAYLPVTRSADDIAISSWTAQSANNWITNNSRNIYYNNGGTYETVYPKKDVTYTSLSKNTIQMSELNATTLGPHDYSTSYYTYVAANGITDWHQIWYNERGTAIGGAKFAYTLYYYTNIVSSSAEYIVPSSAKKNATSGSGNSQVRFLNDYESLTYRYLFTNDTYTHTAGDGKLYSQGSQSSRYNYLYTNNYVLASQKPNSSDSEDFTGTLYANGYKLYYEDSSGTKHYLNDTPVLYKSDDAYTGTLYTADKKTRLDAMKEAATQFIEDVEATGADHKIAVVGFTDSYTGKTGGSAAAALVSPSAAATAISNLTADASNGSNLSKGLQGANSIFAANETDDSRKRVVVVFTDVQPNEDSNSWASTKADAKTQSDTSEETYDASIYTVGICISDADTQDALDKISTNYYGASDKLTSDGIEYAYNGSSIADITAAATAIANAVQNSTTFATLDSSWVLKDIISKNFVTVNRKTKITVKTATPKTFDTNGNVTEWNDDQTSSLEGVLNGKNITVDGFDYGTKYINKDHQNGEKLIVEITGLREADFVTPAADGKIYSNDAASGLYNGNTAFALFPQPSVTPKNPTSPENTQSTPTGTDVRISKHLKVIAGTVLDSTSTVNYTVQLRSIEDEYYVEGTGEHSFTQHDEDHTEDGALTTDVTSLTIPLSLQTNGDRVAKTSTLYGDYTRNDATDGVQTYTFGTGNILDEIVFPHAGWYVFDIAEDTASYTVNGDTLASVENDQSSNVKMTADGDTHYTMRVYVENKDGDENGELTVTNATVRKGGPYTLTYDEDGNVATRTLGTDDYDSAEKVYLSIDRDQNGVTFENKYLEPQDGQQLNVSKFVYVEDESEELNRVGDTDEMDNGDLVKDQQFHFMGVFNIPETLTTETEGIVNFDSTNLQVTKDGTALPITIKTNAEMAALYADGNEEALATFQATEQVVLQVETTGDTTSDKMYVYACLKDGETLNFQGLPAGTSYTIREDDEKADGSEDAPFRQEEAEDSDPEKGSIGDQNNDPLNVKVNNIKHKKEIVIEGIPKSVSPGLAGGLIALAMAAAGIFFLRSKLKEEQ